MGESDWGGKRERKWGWWGIFYGASGERWLKFSF